MFIYLLFQIITPSCWIIPSNSDGFCKIKICVSDISRVRLIFARGIHLFPHNIRLKKHKKIRDAENILRESTTFSFRHSYARRSILYVHRLTRRVILPSSSAVHTRKCVTECDAVSFHTCAAAATRDALAIVCDRAVLRFRIARDGLDSCTCVYMMCICACMCVRRHTSSVSPARSYFARTRVRERGYTYTYILHDGTMRSARIVRAPAP